MDKTALLEDFIKSDDYRIMLILAGEAITDEDKAYLIANSKERLLAMDRKVFIQTLTLIPSSTCQIIGASLEDLFTYLTENEKEGVIYQNKYYHTVSDLATHLLTQDWFKRASDYPIFDLAIKLENLLNKKDVDKNILENMGALIINALTLMDTNPEIFDMILRNYLYLLEMNHAEFLNIFQKLGYEIINNHLGGNQELNANMIIFDCSIMRAINATNVSHFEFYDGESGPESDASAYAHAGTVRINTSAIRDVYKEYENKMVATQLIFYIIGHEIDHVFCERYEGKEANNFLDLKCYNSGIANALINILPREFYKKWHNCLTHEFQANIAGIQSVYQRYEFLPCITLQDKKEANKLLASILRSSYCKIESKHHEGYVGPIEFTRSEFAKYKDKLPGYVKYSLYKGELELPDELKDYEDNLSDYERFILGYYNKYIGIIDLLYKGTIETDNILANLDSLYEEYSSDTLDFPSYDEPIYLKK